MPIICSTPRATHEKRSQIQPVAVFLYFKNEWGNGIDKKQRPFFRSLRLSLLAYNYSWSRNNAETQDPGLTLLRKGE
jgi:hypothetical protein